MRKPPANFDSWIAFYDYLKKTHPELLRGKSIRFSYPKYNGVVVIETTIGIATLERNCWKELQELRLSANDTYLCMREIESGNPVMQPDVPVRKLQSLLITLRIKE